LARGRQSPEILQQGSKAAPDILPRFPIIFAEGGHVDPVVAVGLQTIANKLWTFGTGMGATSQNVQVQPLSLSHTFELTGDYALGGAILTNRHHARLGGGRFASWAGMALAGRNNARNVRIIPYETCFLQVV